MIQQPKSHRKAFGPQKPKSRDKLIDDILHSMRQHPGREPSFYTDDLALIADIERAMLDEVQADIGEWLDADDIAYYTSMLERMHPDSVCLNGTRYELRPGHPCPLDISECRECQEEMLWREHDAELEAIARRWASLDEGEAA